MALLIRTRVSLIIKYSTRSTFRIHYFVVQGSLLTDSSAAGRCRRDGQFAGAGGCVPGAADGGQRARLGGRLRQPGLLPAGGAARRLGFRAWQARRGRVVVLVSEVLGDYALIFAGSLSKQKVSQKGDLYFYFKSANGLAQQAAFFV